MKRLLVVGLVLSWAVAAHAQWVVPPRSVSLQGTGSDYDRPHPVEPGSLPRNVPFSAPPVAMPNWPFPNINVTNSAVAQNEPAVAVNPTDSMNIIIGANDDRNSSTMGVYSSWDGGATWFDTVLPYPYLWMFQIDVVGTDPSVAFTPQGEALYLCGHTDGIAVNDVACFGSTDKGRNWAMFSDAFQDSLGIDDTLADKYFIAVDNSPESPYYGRVYATWIESHYDVGYSQVVEEHSTDNGVTWSPRHYLTDIGHYIAPVPVTEPDGTLLLSFVRYYPNGEILVARSTNGDSTFSAPQLISPYRNVGPLVPDDSLGYQNVGPPDSLFGVNSFPAIAVDASPAHTGRAYIAWCGQGTDSAPHVWLATSDNDGAAWSTPRAIEGDTVPNVSARFFPWIAVDPITGNIGVDYYEAQMDTVAPKLSGGNLMVVAGLYMLHSTDGGATFTTRRISDLTFDPISGQDSRIVENETIWFAGDYIGLAGQSNTWYPVWTDGRSGNDIEIYTSIVQPFAPMPITNLARRDTTVDGRQASLLTWQYTPETTFGYPLPSGYLFQIAKDGTTLRIEGSDSLFFVDTNATTGKEYEVTVVSGQYHSVPDSVTNGSSGVTAVVEPASFYFTSTPASVGKEEELVLESSMPCNATVFFYDALGRQLGPTVSDDYLSNRHRIRFIPDDEGVRFFVIREATAVGTREMFGKLLVR